MQNRSVAEGRSATRTLAILIAATALTGLGAVAQAGAAPWSYQCFDCAGGSQGGSMPAHLISRFDQASHELHWSATYAPSSDPEAGWVLVGRRAGAEREVVRREAAPASDALALSDAYDGSPASRGTGRADAASDLPGMPGVGSAGFGGGGWNAPSFSTRGADGFWSGGPGGSDGAAAGSAAGRFGADLVPRRDLFDAAPASFSASAGEAGPTNAMPEPGAVAAYGLGLMLLAGAGWRRRRRVQG